MIVSDQGSHFLNLTLHELTRRLGTRLHFTVAYAPWSNGTIERANRDVLMLCRIMLSELKWPTKEWAKLVRNIVSALNNQPSHLRDGLTAAHAFPGIEQQKPLPLVIGNGGLQEVPVNEFIRKSVEKLAGIRTFAEYVNQRIPE